MAFNMDEHLKKAAEYEKTLSLTMAEVLGQAGKGGLIVARGLPDSMSKKDKDAIVKSTGHPTKCPIWKDTLGYKSLTVVFDEEHYTAVTYWLSYIHGGDNIAGEKTLPDGKMAVRSDYMCW